MRTQWCFMDCNPIHPANQSSGSCSRSWWANSVDLSTFMIYVRAGICWAAPGTLLCKSVSDSFPAWPYRSLILTVSFWPLTHTSCVQTETDSKFICYFPSFVNRIPLLIVGERAKPARRKTGTTESIAGVPWTLICFSEHRDGPKTLLISPKCTQTTSTWPTRWQTWLYAKLLFNAAGERVLVGDPKRWSRSAEPQNAFGRRSLDIDDDSEHMWAPHMRSCEKGWKLENFSNITTRFGNIFLICLFFLLYDIRASSWFGWFVHGCRSGGIELTANCGQLHFVVEVS